MLAPGIRLNTIDSFLIFLPFFPSLYILSSFLSFLFHLYNFPALLSYFIYLIFLSFLLYTFYLPSFLSYFISLILLTFFPTLSNLPSFLSFHTFSFNPYLYYTFNHNSFQFCKKCKFFCSFCTSYYFHLSITNLFV